MNRKGFFFIIMAFVLISYILVSTYTWVRAIEMEESRYSEAFRTSSMEMLLAQITEDSIFEFANISGHYAFYRMNHHSIENPVKVPDGIDIASAESLDGSEISNMESIMRGLILEGKASPDYFHGDGISYTSEEMSTYTFDGWASQLNSSLSTSGFELVEIGIDEESFEFTQTGFTSFLVEFTMSVHIKDKQADSATSVLRTYAIALPIEAQGMVDPYIARESENLNLMEGGEHVLVGKPIFLAPYWEDGFEALCSDGASGGSCYYVDDGEEGQGWFYGPMVSVEDANTIPQNVTYNYILVGNYSDIRALSNHNEFGAYILTNSPTLKGSACSSKSDQDDTFNPIEYNGDCDPYIDTGSNSYTERPFMVYEGFELSDGFKGVEFQPTWGEHIPKLLFVSRANPWEVETDPELKLQDVSIYDIEMLRDFVMCGYYMPRNNSPSFLHRMFDIQDMFDSSSPVYGNWPESEWGFETTAEGTWAGGNIVEASKWDTFSRVDVEFFSEVADTSSNPVQMIKGMPGCKSNLMCNMEFEYDPDLWHVGHFRLSDWAQEDRNDGYNDIYWIDTEDGEEDNIGCDNNEVANCEEE